MLASMMVSLYLSRFLLKTLGFVDFGIYNVVGGIIVMIAVLNHAMASSTQRFLIYEIGKKDETRIKKVYNISVLIHLTLAIIILIIAELIGPFLLSHFLQIPENRIYAAKWVYQYSIFSFVISIITVPSLALIMAHEKMKEYALIGGIEIILKILLILVMKNSDMDKLILYSALMFVVSFAVNLIYLFYCRVNFIESRYFQFRWDGVIFLEMCSFASWNLIGVFAGIAINQGNNILLNIFSGPVVNTARGIAFQIQSAVNSFILNFQSAVNPAITKKYATGEFNSSIKLVFSTSKLSFLIILFLSLPIYFDVEFILGLWLNRFPLYTVIFTKIVLVDILINSLSVSIQNVAQASGKIGIYQIIVSGVLLLNLPTSYLLLKTGYPVEFTLGVSVFYSIMALVARLLVLKTTMNFPVIDFVKNVLFRVLAIAVLSYLVLNCVTDVLGGGLTGFVCLVLITGLTILCLTIIIGINKIELQLLMSILRAKRFYSS